MGVARRVDNAFKQTFASLLYIKSIGSRRHIFPIIDKHADRYYRQGRSASQRHMPDTDVFLCNSAKACLAQISAKRSRLSGRYIGPWAAKFSCAPPPPSVDPARQCRTRCSLSSAAEKPARAQLGLLVCNEGEARRCISASLAPQAVFFFGQSMVCLGRRSLGSSSWFSGSRPPSLGLHMYYLGNNPSYSGRPPRCSHPSISRETFARRDSRADENAFRPMFS